LRRDIKRLVKGCDSGLEWGGGIQGGIKGVGFRGVVRDGLRGELRGGTEIEE